MKRSNVISLGEDEADAKEADNSGPEYKAPALEKGLKILELLSASRRSLSAQEIASKLGRTRTEIYRMLMVLEDNGYIARGDRDGRFQITSRLFELAMSQVPRRAVDEAAKPVMRRLAGRTLQSCHLMTLSSDQMICIAREESPAAVGFSVQVGFRAALTQSSSGPVYFAFQSRSWKAELMWRLRASGLDKRALRAFLSDANGAEARGYLVEPSRLTDGIQDICAPVFAPDRPEAVACLTIPFVSHQRFDVSLEEAIPLVVRAAEEIRARMAISPQDA